MSQYFEGKRVLVTGGAGAFGQKFLSWIADLKPDRVTAFSRDEMKHARLKRETAGVNWINFQIGDITSPHDLKLAMMSHDIVIHAAAMKHLAECESNPLASTRVNVEGTVQLIHAFLDSPAQDLVFLSSDKSPYASSIYGAQKLIAEKLISGAMAFGKAGKRAFSLRYSNVMDSTGSVFHLFKDLLSREQTVTVNGALTQRGFVSQQQVLHCVAKTLELAKGGEVFVLIPKVILIAELAHAMRDLIGTGTVRILDNKEYAGEKESATLIMAEELPYAKKLSPFDDPPVVMLDFLKRHSQQPPADDLGDGLSLGQCETLSLQAVKEFIRPLL